MELTVYRQATKIRDDGTVVGKGEDTLPYVDDTLFFVADGLGGSAAIRHTKFDPRLFREDEITEALFQGVLEKYDDPRFSAYVRAAFEDLYAVRHNYSGLNIKKSGYFASRIASCILLNEALALPGRIETAFDLLRDPAGSEKAAKELGDYFAELIRSRLLVISKRANLVNESKFSNMTLLGTTLCATFCQETEDGVECIYLTAGDSRPYIWTEAEGLAQLLPDEEAPDGSIYNCINANEGGSFHIRCNYFTFPKPCVLFNASDGCFDSAAFHLSQLGFEKLLLEGVRTSGSMEELSGKLTDFFKEAGRHDDSSTIALKTFGYESFGALSDAAGRRLEALESSFFSRMPDLLSTDHRKRLRETEAKDVGTLSELKDRFFAVPAVQSYCREDVRSGAWPGYNDSRRKLEDRKAEATRRRETAEQQLNAVLSKDFSIFLKAMELGQPGLFLPDIYEAERLRARAAEAEQGYASALRRYRDDFERSVEHLRDIFEKLEDGTGVFLEGTASGVFSSLSSSARELAAACGFLRQVTEGKLPELHRYKEIKIRFYEENRRLASAYRSEFDRCREALLSGEIDLESLRLSEGDLEALRAGSESLAKIGMELEELEAAEETLLHRAVSEYWEEKHVSVIESILRDPDAELPRELRERAVELQNSLAEGRRDLAEAAELQTAILGEYEKTYLRFMGGMN